MRTECEYQVQGAEIKQVYKVGHLTVKQFYCGFLVVPHSCCILISNSLFFAQSLCLFLCLFYLTPPLSLTGPLIHALCLVFPPLPLLFTLFLLPCLLPPLPFSCLYPFQPFTMSHWAQRSDVFRNRQASFAPRYSIIPGQVGLKFPDSLPTLKYLPTTSASYKRAIFHSLCLVLQITSNGWG